MAHRLESRVDAVSVYRRGAIVTRAAELPAGAGDVVLIGGQPMSLDDGSVRVRVRGDGDLRATDLRVVLEAPEPDEELPPARPEDLEEARRSVATLRDRIERVDRERQRIESLGVVPRPKGEAGKPPPPSPAEARLALLELRASRLRAADGKRRTLEATLREAERTLAELNDREARRSSARRTEPDEMRKAVRITLRGEHGHGAAELRLEYAIDAARWAPSYVLRLAPEMDEGTLEVRAVVAQRSGEDWDQVALTLSTAVLQSWAELPELTSVRIGRRQTPPKKSGWRPAPLGTDALFADFDRALPSRPVAAAAPPQPPRQVMTFEASPSMSVDEEEEFPLEQTLAEEQANRVMAPPPMAPSMPSAAPVSAAAPAPRTRARAKRSMFGAALGGLAEGGPELSASDAPAPGAAPARAAAAVVPDTRVDEALLDYGRLRMPEASSGSRGKLTLVSKRRLYIEYVEELHVSLDVSAALGAAERSAREVTAASLPGGCCPPAPSGFDYAYRSEGRLSAASDGVFHNLALVHANTTSRPRFVVVPRESRDAFRFVELDNPLEAPLLDGPIDVYVGGDYLLTSNLEEVPPSGVLRLGLGVEQRLKVSRNARYSEKSGGMLGGKLDLGHQIEVELENLLPRDARVEVRERIPTRREDDDDIRIEVGEVVPPWEEWEPEDQPDLEGGRRWELTVPAREKRTLRAAYTVRIASKNELVGGNRRET